MSTKTYYVPNDSQSDELFKRFVEIRWRERKSESQLVMLAIKEYTLNHSEGNDAFTLDSFVKNPEMEATPTLGKPQIIAEEYIRKIWNTTRRDSIHDFIRGWVAAWNNIEIEEQNKCL